MTASFTLFDLRNFATAQPGRTALLLALVVVFGASVPVPGLPILIAAVFSSVVGSYFFQGDERGRLDILYATSPISRRAVVIGRYVSVLVFAAVAVGLGTATTAVESAVRGQSLGWALLGTTLLTAFGIVAVAFGVQLPWFFAMGFTRGRPMIFIPVAIIGVAVVIAAQSGMLDGRVQLSAELAATPTVLVLVMGSAVLVLSAVESVRLYGRRKL